MITFRTDLGKAHIVESTDELPSPSGRILYCDVETRPTEKAEFFGRGSFFPYLGDRIHGIAFTWDDCKEAYYIPIRHINGHNLPVGEVMAYMQRLFDRFDKWVNQNVKFDAKFFIVDGVEFKGELEDTATMAKLYDSDRYGHSLKPLCREWLGLKMSEEAELKAYFPKKYKNFAKLPIDLCGRYACMDVFGNRALYEFLDERLPESVQDVRATERQMTKHLFQMEHRGMQTNQTKCKIEKALSLQKMLRAADEFHEITGEELVDSSDLWYDIFCVHNSLPVLRYGDRKKDGSRGPSFNKEALERYEAYPAVRADENLAKLVNIAKVWRTEHTFQSLMVDKYLEFADENGVIHCDYNPVIRTGRMSCSSPNLMYADMRAKELIEPRPGYALIDDDASQIEFRLMVHYINDRPSIEAYNNDPLTDFHQRMADLCNIKRKPGKVMNFAIGYGAGKKNVVGQLKRNPDIMRLVGDYVQKLINDGKIESSQRVEYFDKLIEAKSDEIYETYHERLPGLKRTSRQAERRARTRGYVFNAFGRRRHLPPKASYKAFNTIVQGCAMDYIKDRMIATSHIFSDWYAEHDIRQIANVHDAVVYEAPIEVARDNAVRRKILDDLAIQSIPFKIPFIWDMGYSEQSWAEANYDDPVDHGDHIAGKVIVP